MKSRPKLSKTNGTAIIGLVATMLVSFPASAAGYRVWQNCTVSPCVMGVSTLTYASPGNPRWLEGWRARSEPYHNKIDAQRTMCRWHWKNRRFRSPDIDQYKLNCAAICGGNASCQ